MKKNKRYTPVKNLIESGYITKFHEIFYIIPKTTIAKDIGYNNERINKVLSEVDLFVVKDLFKIASLIEIEGIKILLLIYNQHKSNE